jgi:hypothetical protein
MTRQAVRASLRIYDKLLRAYPPAFRQRFGPEMRQVFRLECQECCEQQGLGGLFGFWPRVMLDWITAVAYQWLRYFIPRRSPMNTAFDRQLSDMIWSIATGLRAGYRFPEVLEALAQQAPEPTASVCRRFLTELAANPDLPTAITRWSQAYPSTGLARLTALVLAHAERGGNLADQLEPLGEQLGQEYGSDPAFYPAMRSEAEMLGAKVPQRVADRQD